MNAIYILRGLCVVCLKATPPAYPFTYFNGVLKRAITLSSGKRVPLKVKSVGAINKLLLKVEALTELNPQEVEEVKSSLTWFFSLDYDLKTPYKLMDNDKLLRRFKRLLNTVKPLKRFLLRLKSGGEGCLSTYRS